MKASGDVRLRWDRERFALIKKVLDEYVKLVQEDFVSFGRGSLILYVLGRLEGKTRADLIKEYGKPRWE